MKISNRSLVCRLCSIALLALCLARPASAQSVFQASLNSLGGGAQLNFGRIYLRATGDQLEFVAVIYPVGPLLSGNFDPELNVPSDALPFSLGAASRTWLHGTRTVADQNPFLPAPPWLPHGYDEEGNPIYVDAAVIREADIYTGHFTLPDRFADDLLAGLGHINFNSTVGGRITVMAVPEPATGALLLLAGIGWYHRHK